MARLNTLILAANLYLTTALAAIGPVTDLHIVNSEVAPDGIRRPAVLANGQFPGPLIKGNKGDNFQINVIDELTDSTMLKTTSIHWHGMFQHGTNWADGPAFVNQCPITSGDSFLYNFNVPDQAGTFWYHSHLSTQYCDGLRGPMVVYDQFDPHRFLYDVDNEDTIITLGDWYNFPVRQGPKLPKKGANATVINGLGRSTNTTDAELAVITVEHGKRYRFRLVSISCEPNYIFQIDNHTVFTVIEADAVSTEPLEVDSIQIFAAQRYSFVLHADQPVDNYWIRANPNLGDSGFEGGINSAILRYKGAPIREPTTKNQTSTRPLNEVDLHPLENPGAPGLAQPGGVDIPLNLLFDFNTTNFFINNATFVPPTVPVLLQILSGAQNPHALIPSGSIFTLQPNSVVEISMPGGVPGGGHPFHLHGHTFDVVRSAGSDVYNYKNPVRRDTVNTGVAGDNVTIRFETNNAGPWFFHCHIDFHLDAGFAVVFAEDDASVNRTDPVPQAWKDLCPTYDALPLIDH